MLPRYLPLLTDGADTGEMWLYGLGMPGASEESVIAKAKMMQPMAAALGRPSNEELMPLWAKVVAAGLNRAPVPSGGNSTEVATGGAPGPFADMLPGMGEFEAPEMPEGVFP